MIVPAGGVKLNIEALGISKLIDSNPTSNAGASCSFE